jgi:hypothetical protein
MLPQRMKRIDIMPRLVANIREVFRQTADSFASNNDLVIFENPVAAANG